MPQSSLARSPRTPPQASKKHVVWMPRWILNGTQSAKPHMASGGEIKEPETETPKPVEEPKPVQHTSSVF